MGRRKRFAPRGRRAGITATICGITSPARCTSTLSPTRTSLRSISSWLCSDALETVTPPTRTGRRRATGVSAPVRPTCTSIASTTVVSCCGGNFTAIAQRGERGRFPSSSCRSRRFTLATVPSISMRSARALLELARVVGEHGVDVRTALALLAHQEAPAGQRLEHAVLRVARPRARPPRGRRRGTRARAAARGRRRGAGAASRRPRCAGSRRARAPARAAARSGARRRRSAGSTSPRTETRADGAGRARQRERQARTQLEVRGHVFAHAPVAARRAHHEHAVLVDELDARAVELRLGEVLDGRVAAEQPSDPLVEGAQLAPRPWRCRARASAPRAGPRRSPRPAARRRAGSASRVGAARGGPPPAPASSRSSRSYSASEISGRSSA